jgi:hypothetical protein
MYAPTVIRVAPFCSLLSSAFDRHPLAISRILVKCSFHRVNRSELMTASGGRVRGALRSKGSGAVSGIGPGVGSGSTHGSKSRTCLTGRGEKDSGGGSVSTAS